MVKRTRTIRVPDPFKEFIDLERGNSRLSDGDVCLNLTVEIRRLRRRVREIHERGLF